MPHEVTAKLAVAALACLLLASGLRPRAEANRGVSQQESGAKQESSLDFEFYRVRIEPIFLKQRETGARCYDCHSTLTTRLHIEPLDPGSSSWTESQSRKNFSFVQQLVTPGDPLKSRLLLHPLAQTAGGDPAHTGGKFWQTQSDPEWRLLAEWVRRATAAPPSSGVESGATARQDALDFQFFKTAVQPIFLKDRPGHARCYGCHILSNRVFHLATLSPGATDWTEGESRQNFESVQRLVAPGKPEASLFLLHPLAPEAGGDSFHSGGRQFASYEDPDWITMANWVRSAKVVGSPGIPSGARERVY